MAAQAEMAELARRQTAFEAELARLRELEKEARDQVRSYLAEQLAQIDSTLDSDPGRTAGIGLSEQRTGS